MESFGDGSKAIWPIKYSDREKAMLAYRNISDGPKLLIRLLYNKLNIVSKYEGWRETHGPKYRAKMIGIYKEMLDRS